MKKNSPKMVKKKKRKKEEEERKKITIITKNSQAIQTDREGEIKKNLEINRKPKVKWQGSSLNISIIIVNVAKLTH